MEFWNVGQSEEAPAAIDARSGRRWSYADLRREASGLQEALPSLGRKSLGLLIAHNSFECLVAYLAALNAGSALMVVDATLNSSLLSDFVLAYQPDWIFADHLATSHGWTGTSSGVLR